MGEIFYSVERIEGKDIIIRELKGDITALEIIESFKFLIKGKITLNCVGIITITNEAKFKFSIRQFSKVLKYIKQSDDLKNLKLAILVSTPEKTIYPIIADKEM